MRERITVPYPITVRWRWLVLPLPILAPLWYSVLWSVPEQDSDCGIDDTSFAQKQVVLSRLTGPPRQSVLSVPEVSLNHRADPLVEDDSSYRRERVLLQTNRDVKRKEFNPEEPLPRLGDLVGAEDEAAGMEPATAEPPAVVSTPARLPEQPWGQSSWGTASRYSRPDWAAVHHTKNSGINKFFESGEVEEWLVFIGAMAFFLVVQYLLMEWPSKYHFHSIAFFIWLGLAGVCNVLILWRFGAKAASNWFSGYMLELVFSLENIFVFHIVVRAFRVPRRHTQKALVYVVFAQILFEMLFFMGLAWKIRQSQVLPYILGAWLMYVGYQAGCERPHDDVDFKTTWVYKTAEWVLGEQLYNRYSKSNVAMIVFQGEKGMKITLLFLATVALIIVDFLLEVDVVLTKIEELDNHYLAFTSSAAAAFVVPELFFICRDLFHRFYLMKYGICFILVFFGMQLLAHELISIPMLAQIGITMGVMLVCVVLSSLLPAKSDLDSDEEFQPEDSDGAECRAAG